MDREIARLLARVEEVRGTRATVREKAKEARSIAGKTCRGELRQIKAQNVADLEAARGKAVLREAAGRRRCGMRSRAIASTARDLQHELSRAERRARAELVREERAQGLRPTPTRKGGRSARPRGPDGRPLTADQIEQEIDEARSELERVGESERQDGTTGNAAAARWWFTRRRLRSMMNNLRPGTQLFNVVGEAYADNAENIDAAFYDHLERTDPQRQREHARAEHEEKGRPRERTARILQGAALPEGLAVERVTRALRAREHEPTFTRGGVVRCARCHVAGKLQHTRRGVVVLVPHDADARSKMLATCDPVEF